MKKRILIIGGFHKAIALSNSLCHRGYDVTVINSQYSECVKLAENKAINVILGDGSKPYVLEDAEAHQYDMAIAMTRHDEDNLVICELCKKKFHIEKTVSIVNDPQKIDFFKSMGIDSVVCAINSITSIIEQQALLDDMASLIPLRQGKISIAEVTIPKSSKAVNKKIWEIKLPKDVIIGCILRDEQNIVPRGETTLLTGDTLVLISTEETQLNAIEELTGR